MEIPQTQTGSNQAPLSVAVAICSSQIYIYIFPLSVLQFSAVVEIAEDTIKYSGSILDSLPAQVEKLSVYENIMQIKKCVFFWASYLTGAFSTLEA